MILTKEMIIKGQSLRGGWSGKQLKILGIKYPLPKGWIDTVVGMSISKEDYEKFLSLKDKHLKKSSGNLSLTTIEEGDPFKESFEELNYYKKVLFEKGEYNSKKAIDIENAIRKKIYYLSGKKYLMPEVPYPNGLNK